MQFIDRSILTSRFLRAIAIAFFLIPGTVVSGAYEQSLTATDRDLERWDVPLLRLVITEVKPDSKNHSYYFEANLIEIIRTANINLSGELVVGQWQPYRGAPLSTADPVEVDRDIVDTLLGSELICFTGSNPDLLRLYAYRCFADTTENRAIAAQFAKTRPISSYLYTYAQSATLILPLIALTAVLFFPRTAIVVATLTFPSFIYYNARVPGTTIRYDLMLAYPAMILAVMIIIFAFVRLLHKMVSEEQREKAIERAQDETRAD